MEDEEGADHDVDPDNPPAVVEEVIDAPEPGFDHPFLIHNLLDMENAGVVAEEEVIDAPEPGFVILNNQLIICELCNVVVVRIDDHLASVQHQDMINRLNAL